MTRITFPCRVITSTQQIPRFTETPHHMSTLLTSTWCEIMCSSLTMWDTPSNLVHGTPVQQETERFEHRSFATAVCASKQTVPFLLCMHITWCCTCMWDCLWLVCKDNHEGRPTIWNVSARVTVTSHNRELKYFARFPTSRASRIAPAVTSCSDLLLYTVVIVPGCIPPTCSVSPSCKSVAQQQMISTHPVRHGATQSEICNI